MNTTLASGETYTEPKTMRRAKEWSEEAEEAYRFQEAGYRDLIDYKISRQKEPVRWNENNFNRIKKLEIIGLC